MRVTIARGFIIEDVPLHVLIEMCNTYKEEVIKFTQKRIKTFLNNVMNQHTELTEEEANKLARSELEKKREIIEYSDKFYPFLDTSVRLEFFTVSENNKSFLVGRCITHQDELWNTWLNQIGVKEFYFENSGDPPEDQSEEEYNYREKIWMSIFDKKQMPFCINILLRQEIFEICD